MVGFMCRLAPAAATNMDFRARGGVVRKAVSVLVAVAVMTGSLAFGDHEARAATTRYFACPIPVAGAGCGISGNVEPGKYLARYARAGKRRNRRSFGGRPPPGLLSVLWDVTDDDDLRSSSRLARVCGASVFEPTWWPQGARPPQYVLDLRNPVSPLFDVLTYGIAAELPGHPVRLIVAGRIGVSPHRDGRNGWFAVPELSDVHGLGRDDGLVAHVCVERDGQTLHATMFPFCDRRGCDRTKSSAGAAAELVSRQDGADYAHGLRRPVSAEFSGARSQPG